MLVRLFARHFDMEVSQAYHYISLHGGIEYAEKYYNILHTLPFQDQVEGLACVCHRNGGNLVYKG
ncbi:MAG: DUF3791 domain-containing protein [Alloprevotella sp.]